jgi:hypothetical protein
VLTESSYLMAIYCYIGAAAVMLLYLLWWLPKHFSAAWTCLLLLLAAVALLTPTYATQSGDTLAPAIIVAGFTFMNDGKEAAMPILLMLGKLCGAAFAATAVLWLLFFRRFGKAGSAVETGAGAEGAAE